MSIAKPLSLPLAGTGEARVYVRTLTGAAFDHTCGDLLNRVLEHYQPDLLVGIRTGGYVVAEAMAQAAENILPVLPLTCRRASTTAKSRFRAILGGMPRPVLDRLRVLEHRILTARRKTGAPIQDINHEEVQVIAVWQARRVLVVDDAVDSGVTLAAVLARLREVCPPEVALRSAVITVTAKEPLIEPDFALYRGVLCRFPWSFDAAD